MIIATEQLKDVCAKVLTAVDNNALAPITEALELKVENEILYINITNKEYFVQVKLPVSENIDFHATVNAVLFLKLISQTTTENVELNICDNSMIVKGNGSYTLPLIYEGDKLLELPEIKIKNVTNTFSIDSSILKSILTYNSKELSRGVVTKPVQKLYYIDQKGAITFTTGACVNEFSLAEDVRILLNNRLVKLFKLFKDGDVQFTLGYDEISSDTIQMKVKFVSDNIMLSAALFCDESLLSSVPVSAIRGRANDNYPYSISIPKNVLAQSLNRIMLFNSFTDNIEEAYIEAEFQKGQVILRDSNKTSEEIITYSNTELSQLDTQSYTALLNLKDTKVVIDNFYDSYLTINFGNQQAIVISQGSVKNVIPECSLT